DDLYLRHKHVLRHMPKPPWSCPSVRSKRGPVQLRFAAVNDLFPSEAYDNFRAFDAILQRATDRKPETDWFPSGVRRR
ncbi:hypothetical protein, partial [Rhodovulum steppense]|uniref:hypothetical protein n=1 Tax=Rhodovulum steppense TaxID=540251 RepID=UPI001A9F76BF